jgi:hypothetical protein
MSMDFDFCCLICLFANPWVVELSTCTGVGGWGCFILARLLHSGILSYVLSKSAPHSALAADDIMFCMMVDLFRSGPLPRSS